MKYIGKFFFSLAAILTLSAITSARGNVIDSNPYKAIITRNVFALVSAPATPQPTVVVLLPQISLTGITTILGAPDVVFKVSDPARPDGPQFYILGQGEAKDEVEVLRIDAKDRLVVFKNHGVIQKISLDDGSIAPSP